MASQLISQIPIGNITGIGNLGNTSFGIAGIFINFDNLISAIIGLITVIAGLYFLFQIITSAINWMSAGGDKSRLEVAQKRLQNAFIGLIIVIAAYALAGIVGRILGLNLLMPTETINNIHT